MQPILETRGLTKVFGDLTAVDHVDLAVFPGEINMLLGENGAGKTTLFNTIFGLLRSDEGEILLEGKPVKFNSPAEAISRGLYMVHQSFSLARSLTVAENLLLSPNLSKGVLLNRGSVTELVRTSDEMGANMAEFLDTPVENLPVGLQQRIELMRAIAVKARILLLDEPTSVLAPQQSTQLFILLRKIAGSGVSVIASTHKLSEALTFSDKITVLRRGKLVGNLENKGLSRDGLVELVFGAKMSLEDHKPEGELGKTLLEVSSLSVMGDKGNRAVSQVSFAVKEREIVGIAGISGNGQRELEKALTGRRPATSGKILIGGVDMTNATVRGFMKKGVVAIPDEGPVSGLVPGMDVSDNSVLTAYWRAPFSKNMILHPREIRAHAEELINAMGIQPPNPSHDAGSLSGGNMYKLMLGREFANNPKVLILSNPTKGLDVRTVHAVRERIFDLTQKGCGVVLISEDLEELFSISDTILVMTDGKIVGKFAAKQATLKTIGELMIGGKQDEV